MTAKEYSNRYALAMNYQKVAELAFKAGLKEGREEKRDAKYKKMEKDLKFYKDAYLEYEDMMNDPERLMTIIGGM